MKGIDANRYDIWKQTQAFTRLVNPDGPQGDCFRTAIAVVLGVDRDAIPHFCKPEDDDEGLWWWAAYGWCESIGVALKYSEELYHDGFYILNGKNPQGMAHSVVALNGEIIWDPNPLAMGLISCSNAFVLQIKEEADEDPDPTLASQSQ